jgi:hypothetical protein
MHKITLLLVLVAQTFNVVAQPGLSNKQALHTPAADSQPFLHCVTDEKNFAKSASEAYSGSFELMEVIQCKLHIPSGINKIWRDVQKSNAQNKNEYNYSKDFWVGIRFNFYVDDVLVSTAFESFEKPQQDTSSFTYYFNLDPTNFERGEGDINYAYTACLKAIENQESQLTIEAALASKSLSHKRFMPFASRSFQLRYEAAEYAEWMILEAQARYAESEPQVGVESDQLKPTEQLGETKVKENFNLQLQSLADSTMKSIFGEIGFSRNFTLSCLKNPCEKGYWYANRFESNKPCSTEPQDSCREAIITYSFIKNDVPLSVRMLVTMHAGGNVVTIEDNPYGKSKVTLDQQNLITVSALESILARKFPKDSLTVFDANRALHYAYGRIQRPETRDEGHKLNRDPGYRLIKETKAGATWENGFIYSVGSNNPRKRQSVYHFDAVSGALLWITEVYNVTNDNLDK